MIRCPQILTLCRKRQAKKQVFSSLQQCLKPDVDFDKGGLFVIVLMEGRKKNKRKEWRKIGERGIREKEGEEEVRVKQRGREKEERVGEEEGRDKR